MKLIKIAMLMLTSVLILSSCKEKVQEETIVVEPSLRNAYKDNFYIGTALSRWQINETDSLQTILIGKEFSSITPENVMKSSQIHPTKDTFNFELPDKLVAFAKKNDMHIQGHTLIWHSQLSRFFREIKDSTEMVNAMRDHIYTIVGRYKGQIDAWDVVNEAVNDGDGSLRKSVFLDVLGEDFLALSFKLAAEADPDVKLYYNDYSLVNPRKRAGTIRMIKNIQAQGIRVDGVGMQGHWHLNSPSLEEIEKSILEYAAIVDKVAITELDIDVLPNPRNIQGADISQRAAITAANNPYKDGLPDSISTALAKRYEDIFKIFLKHQDKISRVTLWGVNDGNSWKNNFPARGRTNYPLLFDRDNKPKEAYYSVMALKEEQVSEEE